MKIQIVADRKTMKILCIYISTGKTHDFQLFKNSHLTIPEYIKLLADSGYQGICHYHQNSEIPIKSSKKHPLSEEEKQYNHELSKRRIYIEHINCFLKRFRILSSKYRNRRKRFALRVSLICGIYNFQF